jgi:hypothetical protein
VLQKAAQGDLDRALDLVGTGVDDVGEDSAARRLLDPGCVIARDQRDHGAERLPHDLGDQIVRVLTALAEADEREVGAKAGGDRAYLVDADLLGHDLVPHPLDHDREQGQTVRPLVGDQDTQTCRCRRMQHAEAPTEAGVEAATNVQGACESASKTRTPRCDSPGRLRILPLTTRVHRRG